MEPEENECIESNAFDNLFVREEETDLDPGEWSIDRKRRRNELGQPVSPGADKEGGCFLVVVEAAEEYEEDDEHYGDHHGEGGEGHGVGVVGGDVFDVGGEEAEAAVGLVTVCISVCVDCGFIAIVVGSEKKDNDWFNHSKECSLSVIV